MHNTGRAPPVLFLYRSKAFAKVTGQAGRGERQTSRSSPEQPNFTKLTRMNHGKFACRARAGGRSARVRRCGQGGSTMANSERRWGYQLGMMQEIGVSPLRACAAGAQAAFPLSLQERKAVQVSRRDAEKKERRGGRKLPSSSRRRAGSSFFPLVKAAEEWGKHRSAR